MKSKRWIISKPDFELCQVLSKFGGFTPLTTAVLYARGISNVEEAEQYLAADVSQLYDPFDINDMERAVFLIQEAIAEKRRIAVFGDYDVDGVTSTCILIHYLQNQGADCLYYIPDRTSEGYGLNTDAIAQLHRQGVSFIITVDSGITAVEEVAYAKQLGMRIVVTDHHECKEVLPPADAIINPKRNDSTYPFKELAGVGVTFKLICALEGRDSAERILDIYADLIAIGTIADVMQLRSENRIIVSKGLQIIKKTKNLGLRMLIAEAGIADKKLTSGTISFVLAPRINAAGRLGCASKAAELFLTNDPEKAQELAGFLCIQNKERQAAENEILNQALAKMQKDHYNPIEDKIIVLWGDDWNSGVIGIVSSRISDRYYCPTILISVEGNIGKGSGRSIQGFNLFEAMEHFSDDLIKFGGHELAAGLTIEKEKLEDFREKMQKYANEKLTPADLIPVVNIDCKIEPSVITEANIRGLEILEPYGMGNPQPVFCIEDMVVEEIIPISSDKHLKMLLSKGEYFFTAMLFGTNSVNCGFVCGNHIDVAVNLEINEFRGKKNVQLIIKDVKLSLAEQIKDQKALNIYTAFINGNTLTEQDVRKLLPDRQDLVAVWRHINSRAENKRLILPYNALSRRIEWESKKDINIGKLLVCLDVFSESQLLDYNFKEDMFNIFLKEYKGKADISKSVVLATLKSMERK